MSRYRVHCRNGHELPPHEVGRRRFCRICKSEANRRRGIRKADRVPHKKGDKAGWQEGETALAPPHERIASLVTVIGRTRDGRLKQEYRKGLLMVMWRARHPTPAQRGAESDAR
jgi:hypothetical protein